MCINTHIHIKTRFCVTCILSYSFFANETTPVYRPTCCLDVSTKDTVYKSILRIYYSSQPIICKPLQGLPGLQTAPWVKWLTSAKSIMITLVRSFVRGASCDCDSSKSTGPIFMKFGTDVRHLCKMPLLRSRSKFKVICFVHVYLVFWLRCVGTNLWLVSISFLLHVIVLANNYSLSRVSVVNFNYRYICV